MNMLKFFFSRFDKRSKVFISLQFFLLLLANICLLAIPLTQKKMFESIEGGIDLKIITINTLLILLSGIMMAFLTLVTQKLIFSFFRRLSMELLNLTIGRPRSKIEKNGAGYLSEKIVGDTHHVSQMLAPVTFNLIFSIINVVFILQITSQWTSILLFLVPIVFALSLIVVKISSAVYGNYFYYVREKVGVLNDKIQSTIENSLALCYFSDFSKISLNIEKQMAERDKYGYKSMVADELGKVACDFIKTLSRVLLIILCYVQIAKGSMSLGVLIALLSYFEMVFSPLDIIQEMLNMKSKFPMLKNRLDLELSVPSDYTIATDKFSEMEFVNCSIKYEDTPELCLDTINLKIDRDCTGIVGLSGEGKSTLIKLMTGEIKPTMGLCCFEGRDVSCIPRSYIFSEVAYYGQNAEIFDGDLEFNITLQKKGIASNELDFEIKKLEKLVSDEINKLYLMVKNSKSLNIHITEKIYNKCPNVLLYLGFNKYSPGQTLAISLIKSIQSTGDIVKTRIANSNFNSNYYIIEEYNDIIKNLEISYLNGRMLGANGTSLSGGERQRVALARFMLKSKARFFIIDEPFTSLDVLAEKSCIENLKFWMKGKTGVIISHKLNIIRDLTSRIIVLGNGKIVQDGNHEQLLNEEGLYQKLFVEFNKQRE